MLRQISKYETVLFLVLIIAAHLVCWLLLKPVWPFSDDICYAGRAHEFLLPEFKLTQNEFQNRFGVYVPASFLFQIFGANPYTISFWPMLAGTITSCFVFTIVRKWQTPQFALGAALLIALNIIQITYSIALFPDQIVTCFSTGAVLFLYQARASRSTKIIFPLLIAFFLFLGLLTKITIILIVPFVILLFLIDCFKKQYIQFWKQFIFAGILFLLIFLGIYYVATGDPFYRWQSIRVFNEQALAYGYIRSYINAHYTDNLLSWINAQLGYIFILILAVFSTFSIRIKKLTDLQLYLTVFTFLLLSEYVILFHTETYGYLFRQERIWMLLIPPLSILSVYFFFQATKRQFLFVGIIFFVLSLVNFQLIGSKRLLLFLLFSVAMFVLYYQNEKPKWRFAACIFPFLIMGSNFIYGNSNYKVASLQSGNIIKEQLERMNTSGKKIILSEEIFSGSHCIYNNFQEYGNLKFYPYSKYDSLKSTKLYVLINREQDAVPDFIKRDIKKWKIVFKEKKLLIYTN